MIDEPLPLIGGKGLFTQELENSLLDGRIHIAVHSLKDLPVEESTGLTLGAIIGRADVRDVLVTAQSRSLATLPTGAIVGTSSLRRQAQLRYIRPDLKVESIRGNVETRIRKVREGEYDAAILAAAGLIRLGLEGNVAQWFTLAEMMPAPGQGALAIQCRADDAETLKMVAAIHQPEIAAAVRAERTFLNALGGGCATPVGAYAAWESGLLHMTGLVGAVDGTGVIRVANSAKDPEELGVRLAQQALAMGAKELLTSV